MPRYIFSDGKVRVEEDKFAPLLIPKEQFTDSVVFLVLRKEKTEHESKSVKKKEQDDVQEDQ